MYQKASVATTREWLCIMNAAEVREVSMKFIMRPKTLAKGFGWSTFLCRNAMVMFRISRDKLMNSSVASGNPNADSVLGLAGAPISRNFLPRRLESLTNQS